MTGSKKTADFTAGLAALVAVGRANRWLRFEEMAVYVRVGPKWIDGALVQCVQLASLSSPPRYQGRGTFTRLVELITSTTELTIYVEQVLNERFLEALLRRGFLPARAYDGRLYDVYLPRNLSLKETDRESS